MIAIRFNELSSEIVIIDHEDDQLDVEMTEKNFTDLLLNTRRLED